MDDDRRRIGLGRVISILGAIWLGLFFLTGTGLFGSNPFTTIVLGMGAFFPIALLFVGRIIRKRETRTPVEIEQPPPPAPRPSSRPRPHPQPQTRPPDPAALEDSAEAIKFEKVEEMHDPTDSEPKHMPRSQPMSMHENVESIAEDADPMTSEEMLAEAKKRYSSEN
jgi:hypothetical protein